MANTNQEHKRLKTPGYVFDENTLRADLKEAKDVCRESNISLLFPLKSMSVPPILKIIREYVDGFAVSSLFEAKLASALKMPDMPIHYTSPCLREDSLEELGQLCDEFACNSLRQHKMLHGMNSDRTLAIRVNPQLSFVNDERFDPCRRHSKLGIPIPKLCDIDPQTLSGIHFHTNSESETFAPILKTVQLLAEQIPHILEQIQWINFGGGYYFEDGDEDYYQPLRDAASFVQETYGLKVFMEPGLGVVCNSGTLVSTVIDEFDHEGQQIAVMDTTVNHFPEVLEFEYEPSIKESVKHADFRTVIAGGSCLAGDLFGDFCFEQPLKVGDRLTFLYAGAYTMVKAQMFNGINLPGIYLRTSNGELNVIREFSYNDYLFNHGDY